MKVGDRVEHEKFGMGVVEDIHPLCVTVKFDSRNSSIMIARETAEEMKVLGRDETLKPVKEVPLRAHDPVEPDPFAGAEKCQCGKIRGHRGRCTGSEPPSRKRVVDEQVSHKETHVSRRVEEVEENHHEDNTAIVISKVGELVAAHLAGFEQKLAALSEEVKALGGHASGPKFDFWAGTVELESADLDEMMEDYAMLFGAKVPAQLLDAIWYSMNTFSKARLLSALEVARYGERYRPEKK